jgi:periplasmic copper chaperone A
MRILLLMSLLLLGFAGLAHAHSYTFGAIKVGHAYAKPTAPGSDVAAVYMPILNSGTEPDELLAIESPIANVVHIHKTTIDSDNIARMTMEKTLLLPPGKPIALRPGGLHIMLMGLKKPLKAGDTFDLTLTFARAGKANIEIWVEDKASHNGH